MMVDLAIVGAGPAGMAAAALAAKLGLDTLLIDEQEGPGGQIYRAIERADTTGLSPLGADYLAGQPLVAALRVMPPDGLPIYDESEEFPGAFTANCHSGVTLAGAHANAFAPMVTAGALDPMMMPFSAKRFDVSAAA